MTQLNVSEWEMVGGVTSIVPKSMRKMRVLDYLIQEKIVRHVTEEERTYILDYSYDKIFQPVSLEISSIDFGIDLFLWELQGDGLNTLRLTGKNAQEITRRAHVIKKILLSAHDHSTLT